MNCYEVPNSSTPHKWQLLATFTPFDLQSFPSKRTASEPSGSQELVVFPEARKKIGERSDRDLTDLVVLSLLIVERTRLSVAM